MAPRTSRTNAARPLSFAVCSARGGVRRGRAGAASLLLCFRAALAALLSLSLRLSLCVSLSPLLCPFALRFVSLSLSPFAFPFAFGCRCPVPFALLRSPCLWRSRLLPLIAGRSPEGGASRVPALRGVWCADGAVRVVRQRCAGACRRGPSCIASGRGRTVRVVRCAVPVRRGRGTVALPCSGAGAVRSALRVGRDAWAVPVRRCGIRRAGEAGGWDKTGVGLAPCGRAKSGTGRKPGTRSV